MNATMIEYDGFYALRRAANGFEWAAWWTHGASVERAKSWTCPDAEGIASTEDAAMGAADQAIRNARGVKAKTRFVQEKPWVSMPQEPKVCRGKRWRRSRVQSVTPNVGDAKAPRSPRNCFTLTFKRVTGETWDYEVSWMSLGAFPPIAGSKKGRTTRGILPAFHLAAKVVSKLGGSRGCLIKLELPEFGAYRPKLAVTSLVDACAEVAYFWAFLECDSFAVLGLTSNASTDDVRRAYKKLVFEHHPDRGGSAETFRKVTQAKDDALRMIGV